MQLDFWKSLLDRRPAPTLPEDRVDIVRNPRARRYVLRVRPDGSARVTVPRGGSLAEARRFLDRNAQWLHLQRQRLAAKPRLTRAWSLGSEIMLRGEKVLIEAVSNDGGSAVRLGSSLFPVRTLEGDLRLALQKQLARLGARELPPRVLELAATHGLQVRRIAIRNQKSRWGSCSARGTISLNWRLIQAPASVRDYIILHELMHMREMNHSRRFWAEVQKVCPGYEEAERWLKANASLLR